LATDLKHQSIGFLAVAKLSFVGKLPRRALDRPRGFFQNPLDPNRFRGIKLAFMKLRNIPLELDIFCEGQEAERILKINKSPEPTGHPLEADDEPSLSHESPDDEFP
jgi:hypothetical protein